MISAETEKETVVLLDENDEEHIFAVQGYVFYNGEEYAVIAEENVPEDNVSVVQVHSFVDEDNEEMEELIPVEDELVDVILEIARQKYSEETDSVE